MNLKRNNQTVLASVVRKLLASPFILLRYLLSFLGLGNEKKLKLQIELNESSRLMNVLPEEPTRYPCIEEAVVNRKVSFAILDIIECKNKLLTELMTSEMLYTDFALACAYDDKVIPHVYQVFNETKHNPDYMIDTRWRYFFSGNFLEDKKSFFREVLTDWLLKHSDNAPWHLPIFFIEAREGKKVRAFVWDDVFYKKFSSFEKSKVNASDHAQFMQLLLELYLSEGYKDAYEEAKKKDNILGLRGFRSYSRAVTRFDYYFKGVGVKDKEKTLRVYRRGVDPDFLDPAWIGEEAFL